MWRFAESKQPLKWYDLFQVQHIIYIFVGIVQRDHVWFIRSKRIGFCYFVSIPT